MVYRHARSCTLATGGWAEIVETRFPRGNELLSRTLRCGRRDRTSRVELASAHCHCALDCAWSEKARQTAHPFVQPVLIIYRYWSPKQSNLSAPNNQNV
eukprot:640328-Prymnesium_polylepis.1